MKEIIKAHQVIVNKVQFFVGLTALILGTIFFIILTSVMSGFTGAVAEDLIYMQFFLIFFFVPLISAAFIILIKSASPGGG